MSDEDVLRLVGKLVSRATTLMFCTFPDSDCNTVKNAEQEEQRRMKRAPDGATLAPFRNSSLRARFLTPSVTARI